MRNLKRHTKPQEKDGADLFREQQMRDIYMREVVPKYLFWALSIVAVVIVAFIAISYMKD